MPTFKVEVRHQGQVEWNTYAVIIGESRPPTLEAALLSLNQAGIFFNSTSEARIVDVGEVVILVTRSL